MTLKCGKNKHDAIARKLSMAQEKVREMHKAEFTKWIFGFSIINFRIQLRYYRTEKQSKT